MWFFILVSFALIYLSNKYFWATYDMQSTALGPVMGTHTRKWWSSDLLRELGQERKYGTSQHIRSIGWGGGHIISYYKVQGCEHPFPHVMRRTPEGRTWECPLHPRESPEPTCPREGCRLWAGQINFPEEQRHNLYQSEPTNQTHLAFRSIILDSVPSERFRAYSENDPDLGTASTA